VPWVGAAADVGAMGTGDVHAVTSNNTANVVEESRFVTKLRDSVAESTRELS